MSKMYGGNSVYTKLKKVIVRKPFPDFADADPIKWNYTSKPDLEIALEEHDNLIKILKRYDVEIIYHDMELPGKADSIYVFDPVYMSDFGAFILKPGKTLRSGEETAMKELLEQLNIPIFLELEGSSRAEGGDILWVDDKTLVIGQGFRTNIEAINQIKTALIPEGIEVINYHLPYYRGPKACLHLLSFISIVDEKLAVIYPELMPVPFYEMLVTKGFNFVEVPENEFLTMSPNVLAIAPGICLMLENNPVTKARLEEHDCIVHTYKGNEISLKCEGGPTCLTRPIFRER